VFGYAFLFGYAFVIGYVSACQVVLPVKLFICVSRGKSETMILNKTFLTAVALAAPLVISAGVLAPAQAAPISAGSVLNLSNPPLGGTVRLVNSGNTLDFSTLLGVQPLGVGGSTGTFAPSSVLSLLTARIKDVTFNSANTFTGNLTSFISGIGIAGGNTVTFDLTRLVYNASNGSADIQGIFRSGADSIAGGGTFTSQLPGTNPSTYSLSLTAVPTPAALPALIGFGVGLVRKRKAAQLAEAAV
jgi:hypothetical protein